MLRISPKMMSLTVSGELRLRNEALDERDELGLSDTNGAVIMGSIKGVIGQAAGRQGDVALANQLHELLAEVRSKGFIKRSRDGREILIGEEHSEM
jgi:hypothetical protein